MYVTSKAGTEILKSQYEIIDSINGIPTLETDYSQLKHNHTEPMLMLSPAFTDKYIMVLKEQESVTESSRLRLTGVHSFIYDFSLDRIYEEYTQYFSLENILTLVFSDTEYEYEVSGSTRYNALDFENFGNNDKMSLINQICDRWELEYRVKGNKVYFADQRGTKTTKQFRYKMNIHDSHVNLDISEGATYIRAYFGKKDEENPSNSTYVEKEMLHPLAEDFGVRHAKPYSNEVISQEETMQRYMKMKIEETWKLSVEIDVLDLSGDGSAEVGDEVWAIDERMDLKYKTRIVEKRDYYDVNDRIYRTKVVLGNKTFIEAVSAQEVTADDVESQVVKYYNQMIEQLKADFDNDFNAVRDAYKAMLEKAKEDIFTEIAADKDRMQNLLDTKSAEWTENFNQSVTESKEYAEQQAQEKASAVQSNLDSFKDSHQQLYDEVTGNILDIDTFLGDKSKTLEQQFDKVRTDFGTLQTDLDGVESDLTATKTDLQKQLDAARADLDGLEVGGRNLLLKSNDYVDNRNEELKINIDGEVYAEVGYIWGYNFDVNLKKGETYTISVPVYNNSETESSIARISGFLGNNLKRIEPKEKRLFTVTGTADEDYVGKIYILTNSGNVPLYYGYAKLEKGTIATDWTPAPEDTEEKITTLNQQIEFIDGQLSAKLEQTDIEPINNKITEYGNTLTANAQSIESLISKTELHDGDITKWSNQTTANAENITSALSRISNTESGLTKAQTDIGINADGLSAVVNRVNKTESGIESLSTSLTAEAGKVDALITKTDGHDTQLTNIVADYEKIEQTVAKNDDWLGTYGSAAEQTIEGFERRVWNTDITNVKPNLIPWADVSNPNSAQYWKFWPASNITSFWIDNFGEYVLRSTVAGSTLGIMSDVLPEKIVAGKEYTLSMITRTSDNWNSLAGMAYTYLINENGTNQGLGAPSEYIQLDSSRRRNIWRFTANFSGDASVMVGTYRINANQDARFSFKEPKLEVGSKWTPFMRAFSNIEQHVNMIEMRVFEELDGGYVSQAEFEITTEALTQRMSKLDGSGVLTQSDIKVFDDSIILGSQEVSSEHFASILAISPTAIDMITDKLNLTGNLNVKGQIESLAVSAVRGDIAYLKTNILTANSITSEHLSVSTAMVHKLFAASARIDELITKSHFVNNVKAMSIEAVEGKFSSLMTKYLNANYIDVKYINGKNAWFESQYTLNANIAKLTAQHAFIRDVQAIEITANQLNIQTLHSKLRSVEGGLTIYGPDGRVLINNSMLRASFDVQVYDAYGGNSVDFAGLNFFTSSSFWQTFKYFYTDFKGSQLLVSWAVGLQSGNSASEYAEVQVRGFGGNNPIGSRSSRQFVKPGETTYHNQIINLGVPDYSTIQGYLEFRRSPTGVSMNNTVYARILRVSLIN